MKKKIYLAPSLRVRHVQPAQMLCGSTTDSPTGSGSDFGGNEEETDLNTVGMDGWGSNFGSNEEETGN